MQELVFALSEIKELLELRMDEDSTCSEIRREVQHKYRDVIEKIEELQRIKEMLVDLIHHARAVVPKAIARSLGHWKEKMRQAKN